MRRTGLGERFRTEAIAPFPSRLQGHKGFSEQGCLGRVAHPGGHGHQHRAGENGQKIEKELLAPRADEHVGGLQRMALAAQEGGRGLPEFRKAFPRKVGLFSGVFPERLHH